MKSNLLKLFVIFICLIVSNNRTHLFAIGSSTYASNLAVAFSRHFGCVLYKQAMLLKCDLIFIVIKLSSGWSSKPILSNSLCVKLKKYGLKTFYNDQAMRRLKMRELRV